MRSRWPTEHHFSPRAPPPPSNRRLRSRRGRFTVRKPLIVSVLLLASISLLAQGGADAPTTVNLGGGSNWRGTVPTGPVPRLPDGSGDFPGASLGGGGPGGGGGGGPGGGA